jgi:hypothetical protein
VKAASMAFARGSFGLGGLDNGDLLAVGGIVAKLLVYEALSYSCMRP